MNRQLFLKTAGAVLAVAFLTGHSFAAPLRPSGMPGQKSQSLPDTVFEQFDAGNSSNLLVLLDETEVQQESEKIRQASGSPVDTPTVLKLKHERFRVQKERLITAVQKQGVQPVREYSHLPLGLYRVENRTALQALLEQDDVIAVYEDRVIRTSLTQSLPLINQPALQTAGLTGSGSTVAVIDTGVNYTLSAFGSCTAPGVPSATCKVVAAEDIATSDGALDAHGHGTNVSGTVVGVAPGSKIAALDVFNSDGTSSDSVVLAAINWAIANQSTHNIVALNMSLGDSSNNTSSCSSKLSNPYVTAVANAKSAGIISVAASGNNAYTSGISRPACTPGVVSVGAVYDSNVGGVSWTACTDSTTAADKVTCFSNSASFLTMLAPGALITAAGSTMGGTSQATPHVAGAVAVMRSAFPAETLDQTVARLVNNGVLVTDSRNSVVKPRLNLSAAIGSPANDLFSSSSAITGTGGSLSSRNLNAGKETGEPSHAGNSGGRSVWWYWTAPVGGVATIDTHGSSFDTLLAVYTGSSIAGLSAVAASDDDGTSGGTGSVSFTAQAGTTYRIAVDGKNGAYGQIVLNWALSEQADLAVVINDSPDPVETGSNLTYEITVSNNGPSAAASTALTVNIPASSTLVSAPEGCSLSGSQLSCSLGSLSSGTVLTQQVVVNPSTAGSLQVSATVSTATADPNSSNNSASNTTTCVAASTSVPAFGHAGVLLLFTALGSITLLHKKQRVPDVHQ